MASPKGTNLDQGAVHEQSSFTMALRVVAYIGSTRQVVVQEGAPINPVLAEPHCSGGTSQAADQVFDYMSRSVQEIPGMAR